MIKTYGWLITKDHLYDPSLDCMTDEAGTMGPRNIDPEQKRSLLRGRGRAFRIYDDDHELYYSGRYLGPDEYMFGPLEDFGTPNAGATEIAYWDKSERRFKLL